MCVCVFVCVSELGLRSGQGLKFDSMFFPNLMACLGFRCQANVIYMCVCLNQKVCIYSSCLESFYIGLS